MDNKKITKIICIFILLQPFYDSLIYLFHEMNINIPFISFIRPVIAILLFVYLLYSIKGYEKQKKFYFLYLFIYGLYCICHLVHIQNYFFESSHGTLMGEIRYLCNYGYFLLQLINFHLIFQVSNKENRKKILLAVVMASLFMCLLYFLSVITHTSPKTYIYSLEKDGWRGWSVSAHYIGHVLLYTLPIAIYALFEKKYIQKWYKYFIFSILVIPPFYMVGTKAALFATFGIITFYTLVKIIILIKEKKWTSDTIYFIILFLILSSTLSFTFGFANYKNQVEVANGENKGVDLIKDNLNVQKYGEYEKESKNKVWLQTFENRMMFTIYTYRDIRSTVFDNREIQKTLNHYLWNISTNSDKLFGYGQLTMPNCTWVETDVYTIFYCYGIIGFLLIIVFPIGYVALHGLKALIHIKTMTSIKFLLGFGFGLSIFVICFVGYTMQFAQTVFYLIILLVVSNFEFDSKKERETKDYLFAINDLNIGGAEVGMVDVVNELVKQGKKVDVVLLRKRGPLLENLDKQVHVYEILNGNRFKQRIYHILYMLGGPFIKFVYKRVILNDYQNEIAYIEGYPAVFIAASHNPNSNKIASIRVGLKNHKLKANKFPWGNYEVKKAYQKMDHIYTVSDLTTEEFLEKYPFCKDKTSTIYTYFNLTDIRKKSKEQYPYQFDKKKINFLAVGRFNAQKSYDRLIEAFDALCKKNNNVLLHFLGKYDTEEGKQILELIKNKKLEEKVILHGVVSNPYPYMKDCDCLVSSSLYEGFPRVINEAIGLGKLCIGTDVTGTKEALRYGDLGILVEDSIEGIEKGMLSYLENPNIYEQYQEKIKMFDGNKEHYFENLKKISYKKKNMMIYMPKLSFGGMEKALVNLINYGKLNEKYNLTLYLVYKGEMNYLDLLPKNVKVIVACPGKWNIFGKVIASVKLFMRFIYHAFHSYDIAISYSYQHPVLNLLTRMSSDNHILYVHGNLKEATSPHDLKRRLRTCKYEKFKKIICVSEDAKKALVELISRTDNIFVVNNFTDGDVILKRALEKVEDFKFYKNTTYFISICRHDEKFKKLIRIINATKKLNKEGYQFEVLFIGDGEDHKLYEEKIKELKIKNIHLLGKKKNPYKYLYHSNALLLSSIREGYPVVFIESMILNKPIVTTNVSDAKTDIEGKFGIVVENDDDAIYNGMKQFLENGFEIVKPFDYQEFNQKLDKLTEQIYEL